MTLKTEGSEGASQEHSGRIACAKALRWVPAWFTPEAVRQCSSGNRERHMTEVSRIAGAH